MGISYHGHPCITGILPVIVGFSAGCGITGKDACDTGRDAYDALRARHLHGRV